MKTIFLLFVALVFIYFASTGYKAYRTDAAVPAATLELTDDTHPAHDATGYQAVYDRLKLERVGLQRAVFAYALQGWQKMDTTKTTLTIADLSQPSTNKRLYVIDLRQQKLLFNTYVAHGEKSGDLIPDQFSNTRSSFQTSLGFYRTLNTYMGKHGLSLQLKGLEKGFNDNVYDRNIVLHGAAYACEEHIRKTGRLGYSQGCPAVPYADSKGIIQAVKGGSCLFVYAPNSDYLKRSAYLSGKGTSL